MTEDPRNSRPTTGTANGLDGPLHGVRVLDIATVYAAPFAASVLADLGADVVKVELPGSGDPLRALQPFDGEESLTWSTVSRNKRCVTLDLHTEAGQALLLRLVREQDVMFENFRPGTLDRWGLSISQLREANPDLVVVRVSGYGQTGPYRDKAGFGTPATAYSGYAYISGSPGHPPSVPPISLADYVSGLFAAIGALASLYRRDVFGGRGQEVDVALYESMFRLQEALVAQYDRLGVVQERHGDQLGASAPTGTFRTADEVWMVLTTSTERTFRRLARAIDRTDMLDDSRFSSNKARVEHRSETNAIVGEWFARHDASVIQALFDDNGVPVSRVMNMADIFAEPHYAARDMIVEVDHPKFGTIRMPGVVPKFSETPGSVRTAGARLGEHNYEVYEALGLGEDEIDDLMEKGVI
ncbi:CaiB/BaiF CoA transferase family protein [Spelaeicoccus albus]|uniref:Formyl-CoA transferase n=1 Tax=Spelaeicoccus albus TaxID=1280376 RepID=A0A7Z0A9Z4_9MICO|nr:CoA transferase [Spelaeicoccus albus]NYI67124.1 formyl-CoA transferase [Spelaeicoccus albus]